MLGKTVIELNSTTNLSQPNRNWGYKSYQFPLFLFRVSLKHIFQLSNKRTHNIESAEIAFCSVSALVVVVVVVSFIKLATTQYHTSNMEIEL